MNQSHNIVKDIILSKEVKDFIIGTVFGDGHLSLPAKNARLQLTHGDPQKFYIEHKAEILKDICPQGVKTKFIYDKRNNKNYLSHTICTYVNEYLTELHSIFYPQGKKYITPKALNLLTSEAIAYWYMDDGGLGKYRFPNGRVAIDLYLNTYMSNQEHNSIINYFKHTYDIEFKINKNHGMYRLRIGKLQAPKFIEIVKPYILPGFEYKINLL